ncbi:hypothetical protein D9M68_910170 [compost metagenome]
MRHRRHEVVLEPVQALELFVRFAQLVGGAFERARLVFQRVRVGAQLRCLVEDAHHVVQIQCLLLHHRGHHHARRSAADGAGQLRFHEMHQPGVGGNLVDVAHPHALRVLVEEALRGLRPQKPARQWQQRGHLGLALPEHRT